MPTREKTEQQKEAKRIYDKAWKEKNKDRLKIQRNKWKAENKDKVKQHDRDKYRRNRDHALAREKKRYADNKEKIRALRKKRREENPEKQKELKKKEYQRNKKRINERSHEWYESHKEQVKKYQDDHREYYRAISRARRAIKIGTTVEPISETKIYERDGWICQLCHKKVDKRLRHPHPMSKSLDHIIPLSRGGTHTKNNVQLAHLRCNFKAHTGGTKQLLLPLEEK